MGRRSGTGNINFLNKRKDEGAEIQPIIEMKAPEFIRTQHHQVIDGNTVYFPFRPYECQTEYMT